VSPYFLGTMTFGEDFGWGASPDESHAMLADVIRLGVPVPISIVSS
jgi:aryl-alcohol dehydrogenase-like predicted oxidoreductase